MSDSTLNGTDTVSVVPSKRGRPVGSKNRIAPSEQAISFTVVSGQEAVDTILDAHSSRRPGRQAGAFSLSVRRAVAAVMSNPASAVTFEIDSSRKSVLHMVVGNIRKSDGAVVSVCTTPAGPGKSHVVITQTKFAETLGVKLRGRKANANAA